MRRLAHLSRATGTSFASHGSGNIGEAGGIMAAGSAARGTDAGSARGALPGVFPLRLRYIIGIAATASSIHAGLAAAQSLPKKVFNDFKYAATDVFYLYTFPFHMGSSGALTMGVVTAATGVTLLLDDELDRWIVMHPSSVPMDLIKPFRVDQSPNLEALGSGSLMIQFSGGLYLLGLISGSDDLRDAGIGCATAEKSQSMMRAALYKLVSRPRPMIAEGDQYLLDVPGGEWEERSFYGGHAANLMTCATFFSHRFHLSVAEPLMMGLVAGVSLGRVADRAHWLSDSLVGVAVGFFMGRSVARRQLARKAERNGKPGDGAEPDGGGFFATHDGTRLFVGWRHKF
jgi:hypothetical protein